MERPITCPTVSSQRSASVVAARGFEPTITECEHGLEASFLQMTVTHTGIRLEGQRQTQIKK